MPPPPSTVVGDKKNYVLKVGGGMIEMYNIYQCLSTCDILDLIGQSFLGLQLRYIKNALIR